jgi:hypothetical protein
MWVTFRKRLPAVSPRDPLGAQLKAVSSSAGPELQIPARGPGAVASLWIDALPEDGDLANFPVFFGDRQTIGTYLSPISESGGCQMNVRLPEGIQPGPVPVRLGYRETPFGHTHMVEVISPPHLHPRLVGITDAVNLTAKNRAEAGSLKVTLEEIEQPESISFSLGGRSVRDLLFEVRDPVTSSYQFFFKLPASSASGKQMLEIRMGARQLEVIEVDVA